MQRIVLGAAAIAVCVAVGCSVTGPARPLVGRASPGGPVTRTLPRPFDPVVSAARETMADLDLRAVDVRLDPEASASGRPRADSPRGAEISGRVADGRPVTVTVRSRGVGSVVAVAVGGFGDEALSRALLDRIGARLGILPAAPRTPEAPSPSGSRPFFSRGAVPDAVMLRDQAEAGYRDSPAP